MAERVTVFGAGYVGLVTGVCLANSGHDVTLLDVDDTKLDTLRQGRSPIYEPGLEEIMQQSTAAGRLRFERVETAETLDGIVFVAVGTPQTNTGSADMTYVREVLDRIVATARPETLVVMKSTVPPGTGRVFAERLRPCECLYASNPEFLREGTAVKDWYETDRIVLGGEGAAVERLKTLYSDVDAPVLTCDVTSAEMVKYASNAFLATKISFINEIASICDHVGADVEGVAAGIGLDKRIGAEFLNAGIGYGGSCFPKDTRALDFLATMNGYDFNLLRSVIEVNSRQRILPVRVLRERLRGLDGKRVAVLGLTFKPHTDDTREAPAGEIVSMLLAEGAEVVGYNPIPVVDGRYGGATVAPSIGEAVAGSDAAILTTEWPQIVGADWAALVASMAGERVVFDGRNALDPACIRAAGGSYIGVGRGVR